MPPPQHQCTPHPTPLLHPINANTEGVVPFPILLFLLSSFSLVVLDPGWGQLGAVTSRTRGVCARRGGHIAGSYFASPVVFFTLASKKSALVPARLALYWTLIFLI